MNTLVVDGLGTELAYIDSGIPSSESCTAIQSYITIFAVHGFMFSAPIFDKVMALAGTARVRFVAINRRDYPYSTPIPPSASGALSAGTDEDKAHFLKVRGQEIATFVARFIEEHRLPAIAEDGKTGGVALLGWSLGCAFVLAAVANIDSLQSASQSRMASHVRSLILYDPPTPALGAPRLPQTWSPHADPSIPMEQRDAAFSHWITAYFKHGDVTLHNPSALSYVVPATTRVPSIYNMSKNELARMVHPRKTPGADLLLVSGASSRVLNASYKKACYDPTVRTQLPSMKVWVVNGDSSASICVAAFWAVEDDDKARGGGCVNFRMVPGGNHFMHWDEPELALQTYVAAAS